jgi:hypothetical protein
MNEAENREMEALLWEAWEESCRVNNITDGYAKLREFSRLNKLAGWTPWELSAEYQIEKKTWGWKKHAVIAIKETIDKLLSFIGTLLTIMLVASALTFPFWFFMGLYWISGGKW